MGHLRCKLQSVAEPPAVEAEAPRCGILAHLPSRLKAADGSGLAALAAVPTRDGSLPVAALEGTV